MQINFNLIKIFNFIIEKIKFLNFIILKLILILSNLNLAVIKLLLKSSYYLIIKRYFKL